MSTSDDDQEVFDERRVHDPSDEDVDFTSLQITNSISAARANKLDNQHSEFANLTDLLLQIKLVVRAYKLRYTTATDEEITGPFLSAYKRAWERQVSHFELSDEQKVEFIDERMERVADQLIQLKTALKHSEERRRELEEEIHKLAMGV